MSATLKRSDDIVKTDLELTCDNCDEVLCDAEDGDTLAILVAVADEHEGKCLGPQ